MKDRVLIGRKVVITQPHKGRRSKGQDRNGRSGKKGTIYDISGKAETELFSATGFQFKDLQKKLRATRLIPTYVTLNRSGTTIF